MDSQQLLVAAAFLAGAAAALLAVSVPDVILMARHLWPMLSRHAGDHARR